jgi:hypothetical protein
LTTSQAVGLNVLPPLPWQDPCAGVTCSSPPNPICYPSTGTCTRGTCSYAPLADGASCTTGTYTGTCQGGQCLVSRRGQVDCI